MSTMTTARRYLNDIEASDLIGVKRETLEKWRAQGRGPQFIRMAGRTIRYDAAVLEAWMAAQVVGAPAETEDRSPARSGRRR